MHDMASTVYTNKLESLLQADRDQTRQLRQQRFKEKINAFKGPLLLWGCGPLGRQIAGILKGTELRVEAFIDKNQELWGKTYQDYPIISPEALQNESYRDALVIISIYTSEPLRVLLSEWGISFLTFPELAWGMPDHFLPHQCLEQPDALYSQPEAVRAGLAVWADDASREEYLGQLQWRLTLDYGALPSHRSAKETYFPDRLITLKPNEHFVDCGAFDGDSIRELLKRTQGRFKRITAFEPDSRNYERLTDYCRKIPYLFPEQIQLLNKAIGDKSTTGLLNATGTVGSAIGAVGAEIDIDTLDNVLAHEAPTYIKMDIEGFEPLALKGGAKIIQKHRPILAICLYHSFNHLWDIPNYLHALVPDYKLYLSRHADECWESICYAIPSFRMKSD